MLIEVSGVSIVYDELTVLRGFTATIAERKLTAIVGPSGSGKSSLLSVLGGYQAPSAGDIFHTHDGIESKPDPTKVMWIPQGANALPHRSVRDNVAIAALSNGRTRSEAERLAESALLRVGLASKAPALARTLSGGELQRAALARAFAGTRPLILADEPSAGLDAENVHLIATLLKQLSRIVTVVVATHDEILRAEADHALDLRSAP
jgi:ABC-type lipoprotein export system ATPase subunit